MQRPPTITRRDVLRAYEAAARHAGVAAAVDVLLDHALDYAEAERLQSILEDLADKAAAATPATMDVQPLRAVRADRQPIA